MLTTLPEEPAPAASCVGRFLPPDGQASRGDRVCALGDTVARELFRGESALGKKVKIGGAAVVAGSLGPWVAIAAEQRAGGYAIAWRAGSDQYTVWNVDSNGNFTSGDIGWYSIMDASLREPSRARSG